MHLHNKDNIIEFYDEQYKTSGLRDADTSYKWILSLLDVKNNQLVLDVSCGEGILEQFSEKEGLSTIGLDFSSVAIDIARSKTSSSEFTIGDGELLPFQDNAFDYVINLGSLEHYLHMEKGILETARILKKEGLACFLLPNSYYLLDIIRVLITGKGPTHYQPLERFASKVEWQELIQKNGLKVIKTIKYNTRPPENFEEMKWYLGRPKRLLMLLTSWLIPLHFSYSFVFICSRSF